MKVVYRERAVPPTLIAMHRLLASKRAGRCERETLFAELLPPMLRESEGEAPLRDTLAVGLETGLWEEDGAVISMPAEHRKLTGADLTDFVAQRVFAAGREQADDDLLKTLAWLLAQADPLGKEWTPERAESTVVRQLQEFRFNQTSFAQAIHWGSWLGAVEDESTGTRAAVRPDPTRAVARAMAVVLSDSAWVPIVEVIKKLAQALPFLDRGWARQQIERDCPDLEQAEGYVSESLSLALCRLEASKTVELSSQSDAPAMLLRLVGGTHRVAVARLLVGQGKR